MAATRSAIKYARLNSQLTEFVLRALQTLKYPTLQKSNICSTNFVSCRYPKA